MYRGKRSEPLAEFRDRPPKRDAMATYGYEIPPDLHTSAYVQDGKLFIVGLCPCQDGGVAPFNYHSKVQGDVPNGPVFLGAENLHPAIQRAVEKAEGPIMFQVEKQKMKRAAKDLVDRARLGEQNAEAMLMAIRDAARRGGERAKLAYEYCVSYAKLPLRGTLTTGPDMREARPTRVEGLFDGPISAIRQAVTTAKNPAQYAATIASHVPAAGGSITAAQNAASALSHGPTINTNLLGSVQKAFGPESAQKLFAAGVKLSGSPGKVLQLAQDIARKTKDPHMLRAIQTGYSIGLAQRIQVVRKGGPLKHFSAAIAWELGE